MFSQGFLPGFHQPQVLPTLRSLHGVEGEAPRLSDALGAAFGALAHLAHLTGAGPFRLGNAWDGGNLMLETDGKQVVLIHFEHGELMVETDGNLNPQPLN